MKECQLCKNCYADDVATCPTDGMPTMHTIPGEPVLEGKYQIECRLGQGGMGVVYKARHAFLKTQLAIKIILPDLVGNDPQLVTRFRQEALAAAAIRHTNVVGVTDYGVINGSIPYLVMEYVEGESLHDLLARERVLSPERALELISAICAGVGAAHHQGIVHRDLKPLNIMICSDKQEMSQAVKILDFGLAKIKSGELLGSFIQAQTTGLMGSPYYMAPEQWADDEPDARSDVYSLGVMLYQMLAGDVPFKGSSIPAIMKKHISDPPPPMAEMSVQVSPEIEEAVRHSLAKNKDHRTPTVEALISELREAISPGVGGQTAGLSASMTNAAVNIRTIPAGSSVFIDNYPVGQTRADGWITLNGLRTGKHEVRVSKPGFEDWSSDLSYDGKPQELVAELRAFDAAANAETQAFNSSPLTQSPDHSTTQGVGGRSTTSGWAGQSMNAASMPPARRSFFSPLTLGLLGILGLMILGGAGIGGAYMAGLIGPETANVAGSPTPTSSTPVQTASAEMAEIPGGTFKMGRNEGNMYEKPEHEVTVKPFFMDKTEVTNAEYYAYVKATGYKPGPGHVAHWENDKPLPGQDNMPVRFVNADDAKAFAAWRSKRDGVTYRLPTEQEWEFAARNGAKSNLYPWGNEYDARCAVLDQNSNTPLAVGSLSCPDDWGVQDLIGNVYEWTSSPVSAYPESNLELKPLPELHLMIRGGGAIYKSTGENAITSTYRFPLAASQRKAEVGFRLVRDK